MGNEQVKAINMSTVAPTTLGITSNGKPVVVEAKTDFDSDTNFFSLSADKFINTPVRPAGLPYSLDLYKALPKQPQIHQQPQVQEQVAQVTSPTVRSILRGIVDDVADGIRRYNAFSAEKVADKALVSKSEIGDAGRANPRLQAILYQMQDKVAALN